jgi:hypothetical protein
MFYYKMPSISKRFLRICFHTAKQRLLQKGLITEEDLDKIPDFDTFVSDINIVRGHELELDSKLMPSVSESSSNAYFKRNSSRSTENGLPRCMARVVNDGMGGQWRFKAGIHDLCKTHLNVYNKETEYKKKCQLVFNRIDESRAVNIKRPDKIVWRNTEEEEDNLL